jgi:deoxyinosine 3'endonuclease (endonuclease V)
MRYHEIVNEAAYDSMIIAMKKTSPEWGAVIDWGKTYLKRQDRVVWYLKIIKQLMANPENTQVLDNNKLEEFQEQLYHYVGQSIPAMQSFQFAQQTATDVFAELARIEASHSVKQKQEAPVTAQSGDYELIRFSDNSAWWFLDRAYCKDEARSGKHCGNVVGQQKTDQRILSYRVSGHVVLTFILEPDQTLGEMKAVANQKPAVKYHPQIMSLLLHSMIKGITGAGYLPEANFSIFDLGDSNIGTLLEKKPKLIADQITATPTEFMRAPQFIRANAAYQKIAARKLPGIMSLINSAGEVNQSATAWETAIAATPELIINAPATLDNYAERIIKTLRRDDKLLLQAPKSVRFNYDIVSELLRLRGNTLAYVLPTTPRYQELARIAVAQDSRTLQYVPVELRDRELYEIAVAQNGYALHYVPEELRDRELYEIAVAQDGYALQYVPVKLRDREMSKIAVAQRGSALQYVPVELRDREISKIAVTQDGYALEYVPVELRDREMSKLAVTQNGYVLQYVPVELRDREMSKIAVTQNGDALQYVPVELRDREMSKIAVTQNGFALQYVPDNIKPLLNTQTESIDLSRIRQLIRYQG